MLRVTDELRARAETSQTGSESGSLLIHFLCCSVSDKLIRFQHAICSQSEPTNRGFYSETFRQEAKQGVQTDPDKTPTVLPAEASACIKWQQPDDSAPRGVANRSTHYWHLVVPQGKQGGAVQ